MKKVLWLTNIPSPYRVAFFSELGKECCLTVLFEKAFSDERDDIWKNYKFNNFEGIILKHISVNVDMSFSMESIKYILKFKNEIIVVSNPVTPVGIISILLMRAYGIPYIVESDGAFPKPLVGIKGKLKHILYSGAKACFTTSDTGKQYFNQYGVDNKLIFKYPFSSISKSYFTDIPSHQEKNKLKKEMGIDTEKMVISVGQFIHRKGFDILLQTANKLNDLDISFYIVGGTPTQNYLDYCESHLLENVHFIPFMSSSDLQKWYLAADCFVLPTREDIWGLVINEAMANGLPVVTTMRCVAGLEMVNNDCGRLVPIDDFNSLADAISDIIYNNDYSRLSFNAQNRAREYTIESMSATHIKLFNNLY